MQLCCATSQPYVTYISIKFSPVSSYATKLLLLRYLIPLISQKLSLRSSKHKTSIYVPHIHINLGDKIWLFGTSPAFKKRVTVIFSRLPPLPNALPLALPYFYWKFVPFSTHQHF